MRKVKAGTVRKARRRPANKVIFTKNVRALPGPEQGRGGATFHWDAEPSAPRGFGLRVTSDGVRSWVVRYRVRHSGKKHQSIETLGTIQDVSLKVARDRAREYRDAARDGRDLAALKRAEALKGKTFEDLVEFYLASEEAQRLRTYRDVGRILRREVLEPFPAFAQKRPEQISKIDVRAVLDRKRRDGKNTMSNRVLTAIQSVFAWAIRDDRVDRSPTWPEPMDEAPRTRVLSDDEIKAVWDAMNLDLGLASEAFRLLFLTAQRRNEALGMTWGEVTRDPAGWTWTIPGARAKNRTDHRVPLTSMAREVLERVEARGLGCGKDDFVFPSDRSRPPGAFHLSSVFGALVRLRANSRVSGFHLHDLRRTAATGMSAAGVDDLSIARVLNHTSAVLAITGAPRVTGEHYALHPHDGVKRTALEGWERRLRSIIEGKEQASNVVPMVRAN